MSNQFVSQPVKVFLGEDDLDDQEFFKLAFESHPEQFEISCFTNGKLLVDKLKGLPDAELPGLIVLDFNLPLLNGAEVLKLLSLEARFRNIPKLIWSTSNSPACKNTSLENGAADYIVKPSDVEGLKQTGQKMKAYILQ